MQRVLVLPPGDRPSWLTDAARRRGMVVGGPATPGRRHYRGAPAFADSVADLMGVGLLEPPSGWPASLPDELVRRSAGRGFSAEYRLFVLAGEVRTASRYASGGRPDPAAVGDDPDGDRVLGFARELLDAVGGTLPSAVVVDVGLVGPEEDPRRDAAVVAASAAWSAQPHRCDPDGVLDVVLRSAGPWDEVAAADLDFLR